MSKYLLEKSRVVFQVRTLNEVCCVLNRDDMEESMMLHLLEKHNFTLFKPLQDKHVGKSIGHIGAYIVN